MSEFKPVSAVQRNRSAAIAPVTLGGKSGVYFWESECK